MELEPVFDDFGTIEEQQDAEVENNEDEDNNQDEAEEVEEKARRIVKPKRIVKHPRVRLNVDTLLGPRGLPAVTSVLSKCKLKGKGCEREDLKKILNSYKYWCHRMSPKTPFDQAIEIIEKLGTKRPVVTYMKKVRSGLITEENNGDDGLIKEDDDLIETEKPSQPEKTQPDKSQAVFDSLLPKKPEVSSSKKPEAGSSNQFRNEIPVELTEEQKECIRVNRERAMKLKEERFKRIQLQKERLQASSQQLDSQDFKENGLDNSQIAKPRPPDSEDLFSQASVVESEKDVESQKSEKGSLETNESEDEEIRKETANVKIASKQLMDVSDIDNVTKDTEDIIEDTEIIDDNAQKVIGNSGEVSSITMESTEEIYEDHEKSVKVLEESKSIAQVQDEQKENCGFEVMDTD